MIAIVDIDVLADRGAFVRAYQSFGGSVSDIEDDFKIIASSIANRSKTNIPECLDTLRSCVATIESRNELTRDVQEKINRAMRSTSPWQRIKEDGKVAFTADALNAFDRLDQKCRALGLVINPEGELEGFCRTISRSNKKMWLSQVLERDLSGDEALASARAFAATIRGAIHNQVS